MSDAPQPELRWAPLPSKPRNRGKVWWIVGLSVAAVALIGLLLFFLIPRDAEPDPNNSPTPSSSSSPTLAPAPTPTAPVTAPPTGRPDLGTFVGQVQPRLDDAVTGLGFVADSSGADATSIIEQLQMDADSLAGAPAPESIADDWQSAVSQYTTRLQQLSAAYRNDTGQQEALSATETALQELRGIVGL